MVNGEGQSNRHPGVHDRGLPVSGSMDSAPVLKGKSDGGSWALWEKIAAGQPQFGHPANFTEPYRGIEVGVVHYNSPRPDILPAHPGSHGQRSGRRRAHHLSGVRLVSVDRIASPAPFHRATPGRSMCFGAMACSSISRATS
jgi:hypothetical protein